MNNYRMSDLLTDIYKTIYKGVRNKNAAFIGTILYISLITFWFFRGLCTLLREISPIKLIVPYFLYPFGPVIYALICILFYRLMPAKQEMSKQKQEKNYKMIVLLTIVAVISYIYVVYGDRLFPYIIMPRRKMGHPSA